GSSDSNIYFNDPKIDDILNPESFTLGENVSENRFGKIVNSRQVFFKDQKNFYQKLKLYKDSQIDYFLRTYKKTYSEYGKLLITRQLIDSEIHSAIKFKTENGEYQDLGNKFKFEFDEKDSKEPDLKGDKKNIDWISHFFANLIQKVKTPNDLKEITENLTIIIFNYDLLFEYCLDRFCTGDGEWEEPLKEFKKKLKIIHIYGKLGKLDWEENNKIYDEDMFDSFVVREFGGNSGVYGEELVNISKGIKVIAEKQDEENQKHIKLAREKIKEAKKIFFFGFGFDRNNLKLLGFDGSSENKKLFNQKELYCSIYDENEKERALLTIDDLIKDINLDDDQIKL
ncbi:MAG: hypothetical protein EBT63_07370, partial [Proteobacteria bacterium]|nr:hypothetical protein [Pseudomonadota bacterium]